MYDPTTAKFISEDPLGFEAEGTNLYGYVLNNPVNYTDPYGEDVYSVINTVDRGAAGFADFITKPLSPVGLDSTSIRAKLYGDLATRNHDGTAFHVGQGVGALTLVVAGFHTPQVLSNLGGAGMGLVALEVAHTGYGAYESTRNIIEGCATPLDALSFLPLLGAVGKGAKNASKLDALDEIGDGAKNASRLGQLDDLDDAARGLNGTGSSPVAGNSTGIGNAGFDDINPGYQPNQLSNPRNINCVNCAIATDRTLAGYPSSALPANNGASSILDLEDLYNNQFNPISNPADIVDELQQAGNGARGIVYGERIDPTRGLDGHVFNAVNNGGNITFIDGQNNSIVTNFSEFSDLGFLRTN